LRPGATDVFAGGTVPFEDRCTSALQGRRMPALLLVLAGLGGLAGVALTSRRSVPVGPATDVVTGTAGQ
jgi:hypothetical protein